MWNSSWRDVVVEHNGEDCHVGVRLRGPGSALVDVDGQVVEALYNNGWSFDGSSSAYTHLGDEITVFSDGGQVFHTIDPLDRASTAGGDGNLIEAPMPGLVKAVFVESGQNVAEGDRLAILEAMKMEHSLLAARDGVVAEVLAAPGAQVEAGAALVRLEDED